MGSQKVGHNWVTELNWIYTYIHTHTCSIPGSGRSPGEGNGNPLQYYCQENPMDRIAWRAIVQFSSVAQLYPTLCNPMDCSMPGFHVHHHLQEFPQTHVHPTISSSVVPFSSCLQSFPASGSFQISQFFTSGGQSIGASASASVLPTNIQDWFPLGLTGLISWQSKGLSRVFSNTTVQSISSSVLSFLYSPTLTSIHDYWKNHSFD